MQQKTEYLTAEIEKQFNWFAIKLVSVIKDNLKSKVEYLKFAGAFYNKENQLCIFRLRFNPAFMLDPHNDFLYFLLSYKTKKLQNWGMNFEQAICDNDDRITWKSNNINLIFYPEQQIPDLLTKTKWMKK